MHNVTGMNNPLDSFYLNQTEPNRSCLLSLRELILEQGIEITECLKYGMPCFCINKKAVCYLWADKKTNEPYILFVEGNKLNHPKLEQGTRKRMKIFRVDPLEDISVDTIQGILQKALELHFD